MCIPVGYSYRFVFLFIPLLMALNASLFDDMFSMSVVVRVCVLFLFFVIVVGINFGTAYVLK